MGSIEFQMIRVPAGEFPMGEGEDQHSVFVPTFFIANYPVTNRDYQIFVQSTDRPAPRHWLDGYPKALGDHPVVNISWWDALAYCAWLRSSEGQPYRLPTEAEWEKAARGVDGRAYPWGEVFDPHRCNSWEAGIGWTSPVDRFPGGASPYGVLDLIGNVWEWCSSLYADYPYCAEDGREDLEGEGWRVLRGGSWFDHEWGVRAPRRLSGHPDHVSHNTGFRVVREAPVP